MGTMDLAAMIDEGKGEKKGKGESKHYIPFTKPQWQLIEEKYGKGELKPNDLKRLLFKLFGVTQAELDALKSE